MIGNMKVTVCVGIFCISKLLFRLVDDSDREIFFNMLKLSVESNFKEKLQVNKTFSMQYFVSHELAVHVVTCCDLFFFGH